MFHYLLTALIDYVFCILLAIRKNNPASFAGALGAFCLGTWSLELFFLSYIQDLDLLRPIFHVSRWGMFFIPFFFALFTYVVLSKKSKNYVYIVLIPGLIVTSALCLSNLFLFPSELVVNVVGYFPAPDALFFVMFINFIYLSVGALIYAAFCYKKSPIREKQRIKWLMSTLILLVLLGSVSTIIFVKESYLLMYSGVVGNLLFTSLFFYTSSDSILVNLKLAIVDGITNLLILCFYVVLFLVSLTYLPPLDLSVSSFLYVLLLLVVVILSFSKISEMLLLRVRSAISDVEYDYKIEKISVGDQLRRCVGVEDICLELDRLFYTKIKVDNYRIIVADADDIGWVLGEEREVSDGCLKIVPTDSVFADKTAIDSSLVMRDETSGELLNELVQLYAECFIPVVHKGEVIAVVTVGAPLNRSYYLYEDMYLFNWLGVELGQVIGRIIDSNHMLHELIEARKTLSIIGVMNQYHHDIKVPLAIIDGVVSTNIYTPEKQREIVLEQVERGTKMIAMMATMLRGKRTRTLAPLILTNIIVDSLSLFKSRFSNVDTEFEAQSEVVGDAVDLKILFINLVKNSAEAGGVGRSLDLKIRTWEEYNSVYIAFSDSGVGMTKRQCDTLWEEGATTKINGSGIGLQAIKRIASEHNATIRVESKVNVGTTFTLRFVCS
ncbi:MAG: signal transduction histidine kinase [Lentisphaeria bacterium]|jgi:signal transduction histidine kinase